ncbi:MAG: hypothetical protein RL721_410 [Candidatus Eisenbacteria bacterium]|jgi:hypothetical protein
MRNVWRQPEATWRVVEHRRVNWKWFLVLALVLLIALVEVYQRGEVAALAMKAERARGELRMASHDLEYAQAQLASASSRSGIAELASRSGIRPGDAAQIVWLPSEYLEQDGRRAGQDGSPELLAWAGRALQSLVPDATARGRHVD